ncbi:MAG: FAD-binding domain-containing protein, partial [Thalassolituus sp.]
ITQSEKFDVKGNFIAMYIPELGGLKAKDRHFPSPDQRSRCQYPSPIVEHKTARERALNTFKNLTS